MSSIADLLEQVGLLWSGVVRWGEPIPSRNAGVYIVSQTSRCDQNPPVRDNAPIVRCAVVDWLAKAPSLRLDGRSEPSPDVVVRRLREFWLPDESILYIGKTDRPLRERVNEYYGTKLGNRSPHRGGDIGSRHSPSRTRHSSITSKPQCRRKARGICFAHLSLASRLVPGKLSGIRNILFLLPIWNSRKAIARDMASQNRHASGASRWPRPGRGCLAGARRVCACS